MRILIFLGLLAACEPSESKNPLSDPATAKPDPRLAGEWVWRKDNRDGFLHVMPGKGANVDLVLVMPDKELGAVTLHYSGFPTVLGGKSYLSLRKKTMTDKWGDHSQLSPTYIIVRYTFTKDGSIQLAYLDDDVVKKAIGAKTLAGEVEPAIQITADSAKLAAFIEKSTDPKLFNELDRPFKKR